MARFIIRETQRLWSVREVEAEDSDHAWELYCDGQGVPVADDGEIISSELSEIVPV